MFFLRRCVFSVPLFLFLDLYLPLNVYGLVRFVPESLVQRLFPFCHGFSDLVLCCLQFRFRDQFVSNMEFLFPDAEAGGQSVHRIR